MTTLKGILDQVLDETGFSKPSSYFGSTDEAAIRGRQLANASVSDLLNLRHRKLIKTGTISMTTASTYPLPSDLHAFVADTMYEQGDSQPVHFPTTDQQFAVVNASGVGDGVLTNVRVIGGNFEIDEPKNGEDLEYTYRSNHPIQATGGGSTKGAYTADTDVWLLDDRLHILDIIWRWRKLHGMEYQDDLALYKRYEKSYLGRDGGARAINMNVNRRDFRPGPSADLWVD
jgi:hypothetical protein